MNSSNFGFACSALEKSSKTKSKTLVALWAKLLHRKVVFASDVDMLPHNSCFYHPQKEERSQHDDTPNFSCKVSTARCRHYFMPTGLGRHKMSIMKYFCK